MNPLIFLYPTQSWGDGSLLAKMTKGTAVIKRDCGAELDRNDVRLKNINHTFCVEPNMYMEIC